MIHEHPKFFFASLIDPKSSSLALFRSCICSIFFFSKTLHNITLVVNDLQICVYFFLFFYYYKFKSDCCESTSASCYRYLIKPVLTYYPRVLSSKMNNYRGQVYVIIMFVSSLQTFIILGVCKCIKPPVVLHGVPQCQLRLLKIHNISWKPNTQEKYKKPIYSSQYHPLLHCRRGVRRLFGQDITGSSYRSTVKLTCR